MATRVPSERIVAVRAFNRFYTATIGVLGEGFLGTPHSLTEARVIYELAQGETRDSADLRRTLRIDAGYLSRILARFEDDGLIERERSEEDRRRHVIRLTEKGRQAFAVLDRRSASEIEALLSGISEERQARLLAGMETIRASLRSPASGEVVLRAPRSGDFGWVVERHGAIYAAEYGWDERFEALVARIVADYVDDHDPEREAAWIAEVDGDRAGCVLCVRQDERVARLRLLLVEPAARGMGIGRRLVDECIEFARSAGYDELTLWTNDVLHAARRIYERAGFELVEEEPHHSFGADLVGQNWRLALRTRD